MGYARIQTGPFRVDDVMAELRGDARVGGVTLYVGTVRVDDGDRRIDRLEYEAYEDMALPVLDALRRETVERFRLVDATVIHRIGSLGAGEPILLVALAGRHRGETYEAVAYFMDRLKADVPIWKKEVGSKGPRWVLGSERRTVEP